MTWHHFEVIDLLDLTACYLLYGWLLVLQRVEEPKAMS